MKLIAYGPKDFDMCVNEAARFLREGELEAYAWVDGKELTRWIANRLSISYAKSTAVVSDLHDLGLIEAHYGRYRLKRGSFSI